MARLNDSKPPPPTASVDAEAAILEAQVIDVATTEKDRVAEDAGEKDAVLPAKKADAGFAHYIVSFQVVGALSVFTDNVQRVFKYGTALDYLLLGVCCLTSIGSGVVSHSARYLKRRANDF